MIKKIVSRSGKEIIPKNEETEYLDEIIKSRYSVFFNCKKCGEEVSKQKREQITEDFFLCGNCKKEKTNLEKHGVKHYTNREKFKQTISKENYSNNSKKAIQTKIEKYGSVKEIVKKSNQTKLERYGSKNNIEKIKKTNLEKYGEEFPNLVKDGSNNNPEKVKKTLLEKHGVENVFQLEEIKEKSKQTKLQKYGDLNYHNIEKMKQTNLKKYGVEFILSNKSIQEKIKTFKLEKHGNEHYINIEKVKQTNLERYGSISALKNKKILDNLKHTNIEKYGIENVFQLERIKQKLKEKKFLDLKVFQLENITPLFTINEYNGVQNIYKYKFQCKTCNTIFEDHLQDGRIPRCPTCFPLNRSKGEIELASFIKEHVDIIENDRELIKPKEIDILIPSKKLAIEYNGEFWHQDEEREENKRNLIESAGYEYIVIWEESWINNKEEVKKELLLFTN